MDIDPPAPTPSAKASPEGAPPVKRPSARPEDLLHWTDADEDIETAFSQLETDTGSPLSAGQLADDPQTRARNLELFTQLAIGYARPLRDFMLELSVGATTTQWLDVVRPALKGIRQGADEFGEPALASALEAFERAAAAAGRSATASQITDSGRQAILNQYKKLAEAWPSVFDVSDERSRREPIVVHQLLLQVPGVHKVTLDRLYGAGLHSLEAYCCSSTDDLIGLSGVSRDRAEAIRNRFQEYWRHRTGNGDQVDLRTRAELGRALGELSEAHDAFQRAELREDRELKRDARRARRSCMLQVNVLLAELGEVDLVQELDRFATAEKIERVRAYIRERSGSVHA